MFCVMFSRFSVRRLLQAFCIVIKLTFFYFIDIESKILEKEYRDNFLTLITQSNNVSEKENFVFINWSNISLFQRIVSEWLLKERLDYDTIGDARIISNSKQAQTKYIKLKTKL